MTMSEPAKDCCEVWAKICGYFEWMTPGDSSRIMPHITHRDAKFRVNYCPSCGAECRAIETTSTAVSISRAGLELFIEESR
jgi:hypothetical protein